MLDKSFYQVFAIVFLTLGQLLYIIIVKPFESPKLNFLEGFNEVVILVCTYHLFFFMDGNIDSSTKYLAGWSLDLLIIAMFLINSVIVLSEFFRKCRLILRLLCLKAKRAVL
jgi:hypothetical protein